MNNTNQINNSIPTSQPNPVLENKDGKKGFPKWILLEIFLFLFLALTLFYTFFLPDILNKFKKPPESPVKEIKKVSMENWKTFNGKYIGISFKYPNGWVEVDSEYVSKIPVQKPGSGLEYMDEGKVTDLIQIFKHKSTNSEFKEIQGIFNNTNTLKDKQEFADKSNGTKTRLIEKGTIKSGEEYIIAYRFSNSYDPYYDEYFALAKGVNNIYRFYFSGYDEEGANIFANIIPTSIVDKNFDESGLRTYETKYYSIQYPQDIIIDIPESTKYISIGPLDVGDNSGSTYFKNSEGQFVELPWLQTQICRAFDGDTSEITFKYINGYPALSKKEKLNGVGQITTHIYVFNDSYSIEFRSRAFKEWSDKDAEEILNLVASTIKFKDGKNIPDTNVKMPLEDSLIKISDYNCDNPK